MPGHPAETVGLLETLYDLEGSITAAAEKLHMHKNTLQYKLRRIYERTGYDPRSIRWSSLFYIAIDFYREIRNLRNGMRELGSGDAADMEKF